jgi:RNA polymerase sigma factor (sigma-70 family)
MFRHGRYVYGGEVPVFRGIENFFSALRVYFRKCCSIFPTKSAQLQIPSLHNEAIILALRSGQAQAVEDLYVCYRADFFRWAGRRFATNSHDFEDAWQEAVIAFYTQVISGKLTSLRYEARVWLFAVGYKHLLKNNRKLKRILWKDSIDDMLRRDASWVDYQENQIQEERKESLQTAMKTMSHQCREMLVQRYFLEKSIEDMQLEWEHNSANTTSATLSRCLKRLKDIIKTTRTVAIR